MHPSVELLPEEADPTLVAILHTDHRHERPSSLDTYYPAIGARRTNRMPFHDRVVPTELVDRLAEAASIEDASLRIYDDPREVERIVELLHRADLADRADPARVVERQVWIGGPHRRDGIPVRSLGPRPTDSRTPIRDLGQAVMAGRELTSFERTPTVAARRPPRLGAGGSGPGARPAGGDPLRARRLHPQPATGASRAACAGPKSRPRGGATARCCSGSDTGEAQHPRRRACPSTQSVGSPATAARSRPAGPVTRRPVSTVSGSRIATSAGPGSQG